MKNLKYILLLIGLVISFSAYSQIDITKRTITSDTNKVKKVFILKDSTLISVTIGDTVATAEWVRSLLQALDTNTWEETMLKSSSAVVDSTVYWEIPDDDSIKISGNGGVIQIDSRDSENDMLLWVEGDIEATEDIDAGYNITAGNSFLGSNLQSNGANLQVEATGGAYDVTLSAGDDVILSPADDVIINPTGDSISVSSNRIQDLAEPVDSADAATKYYVDSQQPTFQNVIDNGAIATFNDEFNFYNSDYTYIGANEFQLGTSSGGSGEAGLITMNNFDSTVSVTGKKVEINGATMTIGSETNRLFKYEDHLWTSEFTDSTQIPNKYYVDSVALAGGDSQDSTFVVVTGTDKVVAEDTLVLNGKVLTDVSSIGETLPTLEDSTQILLVQTIIGDTSRFSVIEGRSPLQINNTDGVLVNGDTLEALPKVKTSTNDLVASYLEDKIVGGDGLTAEKIGEQEGGLIDEVGNIITSNGGTSISQTQAKFGDASMSVDGATGSYLSVPDNETFNFGSGDFTIDCWVYPTAFSASQWIYGQSKTTAIAPVGIAIVSGSPVLLVSADGSSWVGGGIIITSSIALTLNSWQHVAVVRQSGNFYMYVDGVAAGSYTLFSGAVYNSSDPLILYNNANSGTYPNPIQGYSDEMRVSDTARWATAFTPETSEYSVDGKTVFLSHFNTATGTGNEQVSVAFANDTTFSIEYQKSTSDTNKTSVIQGRESLQIDAEEVQLKATSTNNSTIHHTTNATGATSSDGTKTGVNNSDLDYDILQQETADVNIGTNGDKDSVRIKIDQEGRLLQNITSTSIFTAFNDKAQAAPTSGQFRPIGQFTSDYLGTANTDGFRIGRFSAQSYPMLSSELSNLYISISHATLLTPASYFIFSSSGLEQVSATAYSGYLMSGNTNKRIFQKDRSGTGDGYWGGSFLGSRGSGAGDQSAGDRVDGGGISEGIGTGAWYEIRNKRTSSATGTPNTQTLSKIKPSQKWLNDNTTDTLFSVQVGTDSAFNAVISFGYDCETTGGKHGYVGTIELNCFIYEGVLYGETSGEITVAGTSTEVASETLTFTPSVKFKSGTTDQLVFELLTDSSLDPSFGEAYINWEAEVHSLIPLSVAIDIGSGASHASSVVIY